MCRVWKAGGSTALATARNKRCLVAGRLFLGLLAAGCFTDLKLLILISDARWRVWLSAPFGTCTVSLRS